MYTGLWNVFLRSIVMVSFRSFVLASFGFSLLGSMVGVVAHPDAKKCPYVINLESKIDALEKKIMVLESKGKIQAARGGAETQARGPRGQVGPKKKNSGNRK